MTQNPRNLKIEDFNYPLPEGRIAIYPLEERDSSKLLVYKNGKVSTSVFRDIPELLPQDSLLVFNDTKVVRARLIFFKRRTDLRSVQTGERASGPFKLNKTDREVRFPATDREVRFPATDREVRSPGARIEIFILEPCKNPDGSGTTDIQLAFSAVGSCTFKCFIGNNKKWKEGPLYMDFEGGQLQARRVGSTGDAYIVEFLWNPQQLSFSEVLEATGKVPLPPYIHREAEDGDVVRYQTVFAKHDGSVAAPTAGLHFTQNVLNALKARGIQQSFVTLHVGAGTFKPVKSGEIGGHAMHREPVVAGRGLIENLLDCIKNGRPVIPVGTTSMRSIESLYWLGVRLVLNPQLKEEDFCVNQWDPYNRRTDLRSVQDKTKNGSGDPFSGIGPEAALQALLDYMQRNNLSAVRFSTALMIAPGYKFAFCNGIITNFHQPQSTLLLLVSALIGPVWRNLYDYALQNNFRFLSYGDSCLFLGERVSDPFN